MRLLLALAAVGATVGVLAATGCAGSPVAREKRPATPSVLAQPEEIATKVPIRTPTMGALAGAEVQRITIRVVLRKDGLPGEETLGSNFAVRASVPVVVTINNYTSEPHTFTSSDLGLSVFIPSARRDSPGKAVFAFTPGRRDVFRWRCAVPCGGDPMGGAVFAVIV